MDTLKNFIIKNKFNFFILALWLIITITTMLHHEVWRDEAQVWCLIRDLPFDKLLNAIKVEGHPALWYFINYPFVKLGCDVISMQILALISVFFGIVLLVFKSPFNKLITTLLLFSSGLLYWFPIISRNYALVPFCIFLTAFLYKKRKEHPYFYLLSLFLLMQTHSLIFAFVGMLLFFFTIETMKEKENQKDSKLILFFILFFIYIFNVFMIGMEGINKNISVLQYAYLDKTDFISSCKNYAYTFFENLSFSMNEVAKIILFYGNILIASIYLAITNKKLATVFVVSFAYIFTIYYQVWGGGIPNQKNFIIVLILLAIYWMIKEENNKKHIFMQLPIIFFLVLSILPTYNLIKKDYYLDYSGGKKTAKFIKKVLSEEKVIGTVGYTFSYSVISVYLKNQKLYDIKNKKYLSANDFNVNNVVIKEQEPLDIKYVIYQEDFNDKENHIFYSGDEIANELPFREVFFIHEKN